MASLSSFQEVAGSRLFIGKTIEYNFKFEVNSQYCRQNQIFYLTSGPSKILFQNCLNMNQKRFLRDKYMQVA
jgi:hypothetical protein